MKQFLIVLWNDITGNMKPKAKWTIGVFLFVLMLIVSPLMYLILLPLLVVFIAIGWIIYKLILAPIKKIIFKPDVTEETGR